MIAGRNVVVFSDNTGVAVVEQCMALELNSSVVLVSGAEAATRKGSTKNFDQHSLVHGMWKRFAELKVGVWVMRVPTDDNIADCPSRSFLLCFAGKCGLHVGDVPGNSTSSLKC